VEPTADDVALVQRAFATLAADPARPGAREALEAAEADFTRAIARWEGPLRGTPGDRVQLRLGRAQARITINDTTGGKMPEKAEAAVEDFDEVLRLMEADMSGAVGTFDYPSVYVRRALAKEEIAYGRKDRSQWAGAAEDYTRAIDLWRDGIKDSRTGPQLGVNPMVLNFRGNALSQLGRFEDALADYQEATKIFVKDGEWQTAALSRSNEGLALFGAGRRSEGVARMELAALKDPAMVDPHVALAAAYWASGDVGRAEEQWQAACEKTGEGCSRYKDLDWVKNIRRFPSTLVSDLGGFLRRQLPTGADQPGSRLR